MSFNRMQHPVNRSVLPEESVQFHTHSTPVAQCPVIYVPDMDGGSHREISPNPMYQINWTEVKRHFHDAIIHAHDTGASHVDIIIAVRGAPDVPAPVDYLGSVSTTRQPKRQVRKITLRKDTDAQH